MANKYRFHTTDGSFQPFSVQEKRMFGWKTIYSSYDSGRAMGMLKMYREQEYREEPGLWTMQDTIVACISGVLTAFVSGYITYIITGSFSPLACAAGIPLCFIYQFIYKTLVNS